MTINFKLRKYINSDGLSPIYLNVSSKNRRVRLNLDIFVKAKYWNAKDCKLNGPAEEVHDTNLLLNSIRTKINNIQINYRLSSKTLTIDSFLDEFNNEMPRANFVAFYHKVLTINKQTMNPNTYKKEIGIFRKLKAYKPEIIFCDIDQHFFVKYRGHMAALGNAKTTRNNNIKVIKKYLRYATKLGIKLAIDLEDIKPGSTKGNRTYLNAKEIECCYNYCKSEFISPSYKLVLGYFLFSCFTGLRISDVMAMKRQHIKHDSYTLHNVKGQKLQVINFNEKAKFIINDNPDLFVKHYSEAHVNEVLKKIMDALNINKKVSFHVARHSFATNLIIMGCPVTTVQQLLNHSDIKDTMCYVHLAEQEKNNNADLLDGLFK
ncbi:site-specific integrase [Mariniflexile rhizosphaerae]|uniref:site-specific integrase n=1 Tax=unclassified Mariniflexile TaxID=2643887 RepID=UPI0013C36E54|nr:site-specific integrase [Mariniflexile sp. TRM1-10]